ncbi:hypothetical protein HY418_01295 [Candidatus Kaiserbacteria bacterium]|nr:hypothetical protein [Candidatus Kaiserbacteria bacterium]
MFLINFLTATVVGGFYLFLIVYIANMVPVGASSYFRKRGWPNGPIWKSLFGENKTWVGTGSGLLAAMVTAFAENGLNAWFDIPKYLHMESIYALPWPLLGLAMGGGALVVGDMMKSVVKRHVAHIKPGGIWKPWDDLDFGLGTTAVLILLLVTGFIELTWNLPLAVLSGVLIGFYFNPKVNKWSHRRGIKAVGH